MIALKSQSLMQDVLQSAFAGKSEPLWKRFVYWEAAGERGGHRLQHQYNSWKTFDN